MAENGMDFSLEYDLRQSRLEMIGQVVNNVRSAQHKVEINNEIPMDKKVKRYRAALMTLYQCILPYTNYDNSDQETTPSRNKELEDIDSLMGQVDYLLQNTDPEKKQGRAADYYKERLRKADRKLNKKRIDLNLDIPKKSKVDEGQELVS